MRTDPTGYIFPQDCFDACAERWRFASFPDAREALDVFRRVGDRELCSFKAAVRFLARAEDSPLRWVDSVAFDSRGRIWKRRRRQESRNLTPETLHAGVR